MKPKGGGFWPNPEGPKTPKRGGGRDGIRGPINSPGPGRRYSSVPWPLYFIIVVALVAMLFGCAAMTPIQPQEVVITIKTPEASAVKVADSNIIAMTMTVPNPRGSLSPLSFIGKKAAFIKIYSGLSVDDVQKVWNDFVVIEDSTEIRMVNLFISSPGGDAFAGLALADELERARRKGFHITAHASGVIASAALPVFAVCDKRLASPGTIFMVHEASLWKWPGRETASDIRAQGQLLDLIRDRYLSRMARYSKLDKEGWAELEGRTTWFSVEQAKEWGLVDVIE